MLDELVRTGLAEVDGEGRIRNTGRTYIPSQLDPAAIERLGNVVGRVAETLDFNNRRDTGGAKRFERQVATDIGLTEEQYEHFTVYLRQKCQQLLETLDDWLAMQEGRIGPAKKERLPKKKLITGVGVYHFLEQRLRFEKPARGSSPRRFDDEDNNN
jgi:hypothetical protein